MKNIFKFPPVLNQRLLEAVKNLVRYSYDTEWRTEQEKLASNATDGNVTFLDTLKEKVEQASATIEGTTIIYVAEKKNIQLMIALGLDFFVAIQLLELDETVLLQYMSALNLNSFEKNKIYNGYRDLRRESHKAQFFTGWAYDESATLLQAKQIIREMAYASKEDYDGLTEEQMEPYSYHWKKAEEFLKNN